jgi:hypothetical protein
MLMVEMSDFSEDDAAALPAQFPSSSSGSNSASASIRDVSARPLPKPHPPVRPPSQADIDGMPRSVAASIACGGVPVFELFLRLRLSFTYSLDQMTEFDAQDAAAEEEAMALIKCRAEDAEARKALQGALLQPLRLP